MSWNEPGNDKDPWENQGNQANDLDAIVQNWQKKLSAIVGGGGRGGDKRPDGVGSSVFFVILLLLVAWASSGIYRVDEAERGVVLRFGDYVGTTMPGLHWHIPFPIESAEIVNVEVVNTYKYRNQMLTADENFVAIEMAVQYRNSDPVAYSFNVSDPEQTLREVSESAIREVTGTSTLDTLVQKGRDQIPPRALELIQATLDIYEAGITVTSVNLADINYPEQVKSAVADATQAREDEKRYKLEAQTYANDIVPKARGEAERQRRDAEAYRARVIADAEGESSRFEALLTQYSKAPGVTRERLYIEAVEDVLANSNKILIDAEGSGNLLYLPIDKMIQNRQMQGDATSEAGDNSLTPSEQSGDQAGVRRTTDSRTRRTRQ
jgi:membrane protease subunit HflK